MHKKLKQSSTAEQLRFFLFELGIYLNEAQAKFYTHQSLAQLHDSSRVLSPRVTLLYTLFNTFKHESRKLQQACLPNDASAYQKRIRLEQMTQPSQTELAYYSSQYQFSAREALAYLSPTGNKINLQWHAIHRSLIEDESDACLLDVQQAFPREMALWHESLYQRKINAAEYMPLPVHPWHYKHILLKNYKEAYQEKSLIGPLFSQATYPTADPFFLNQAHPNRPGIMVQINPTSDKHKQFKDQLLKDITAKHAYVDCMTEQTLINLKHASKAFSTHIVYPSHPSSRLDADCISIKNLIGNNIFQSQPYLIYLLQKKNMCATFFVQHFFFSLFHFYTDAIKQNLYLALDPKHLYIIFDEKNLFKICFSAPKFLSVAAIKSPQKLLENFAEQILICLKNHSANFDIQSASAEVKKVLASAINRHSSSTSSIIFLKSHHNIVI